MNQKERLELAKWAMNYALKHGADQVSVGMFNQREVSIEYRDKRLEELKESTQNSLNADIYADHRYSSHSTNDLRRDSLEKFLDEAIAATKYLARDEYRSLADPKYYPKGPGADLEIYDPAYDGVESPRRVKMAEEIEAAATGRSKDIISVTSWYEDTYGQSCRVNSNGFEGESRGTTFGAGAEVTVRDGDEGRPSDYFWASTRYFKDLPSTEDMGKWAVERAVRKIGQRKLHSGKYDMVLENRNGGRFLGLFGYAYTAQAIQQKNSFLDGMLGEKIASDLLTVTDDPALKRGLSSRHYDGDGIAAKRRVILDKGVLKTYLVDDYYGKKLGWEPNGGQTSNLVFALGDKSQDDMVKGVKRGILVTGFIGGNSNAVTGDFSIGIVGQLIEDGKLVQPVNEMNIAGNAREVLSQVAAVGNDPYPYSSNRTPTLWFKDVTFSGI
jgi:PmbA protein